MNSDMSTDGNEHRGFWSRIKRGIGISEIDEEEFPEEVVGADDPRGRPLTLRLHSARVSHVSVRQPTSFEDARLAADGLKEGRQQIINLEKSDQEMSERIIDFLNGVTYALNGFVEKVGERVYLFAPSNVVIDVPDDLHKASPGVFETT
ncbi:MAG: cell division protein SepF [Armatimonadota bacterium]|nr:cell division protein SepF [Armatimonadota bacterium]MDH7481192.1 cell division protein SepF [Armatimonadota bacterium]